MRLFHMTDKEKAEAILKDGFRDNTSYFRSDLVEIQDGFGNYRPDAEYTGVWVSGEPWDIGYLDGDHTLLAIEIPADILPEFQWLEEGELFGKWLIPAAILNSYGPPMVDDPRDWIEDYDEMEAFSEEWKKLHPELLNPPSDENK
mgnify:FL=1